MALSSTSSTRVVQAQYDDNASYDLNGSVAQCKLFIEACRILLRRVPDETFHGGTQADGYRNDPSKIQDALERAEFWWQANDPDALAVASGGGVVHFDNAEIRRD